MIRIKTREIETCEDTALGCLTEFSEEERKGLDFFFLFSVGSFHTILSLDC